MIVLVALLLVIFAATLGAIGGAFGGRWLVRRELFPIIANARASSLRANTAAATVEAIAAEWPGFLERVEGLDRLTEEARDVIARQDALESAIAGAFNISVRAAS